MSRSRKTAKFLANSAINVLFLLSGALLCYRVFGFGPETFAEHLVFMVTDLVSK